MRPLTSGRTLTCSDGVISPAALTAKRMLRFSMVEVVGRAVVAVIPDWSQVTVVAKETGPLLVTLPTREAGNKKPPASEGLSGRDPETI